MMSYKVVVIIFTNIPSESKTIIGLTGKSVDFSIATYGWLERLEWNLVS